MSSAARFLAQKLAAPSTATCGLVPSQPVAAYIWCFQIDPQSNPQSRPIERFGTHQEATRALSVCPYDSRFVASTSQDGHLSIRDLAQSTIAVPQWSFSLPAVGWCLCWLSDLDVVVGLGNGRVLKYCRGLREFEDLTEGEGMAQIINVQYEKDHRTLFIASLREIRAYRGGQMQNLIDTSMLLL